MWREYNPSPKGKRVGDCVIRAISKALDQSWDETYTGIVLKGYELCDMPSSNFVWGEYLKDKGFRRHLVPYVGEPYTVSDFAMDNPTGTYVLAISGHVVCVKQGTIFDTWDSSDEIPIYYWEHIDQTARR